MSQHVDARTARRKHCLARRADSFKNNEVTVEGGGERRSNANSRDTKHKPTAGTQSTSQLQAGRMYKEDRLRQADRKRSSFKKGRSHDVAGDETRIRSSEGWTTRRVGRGRRNNSSISISTRMLEKHYDATWNFNRCRVFNKVVSWTWQSVVQGQAPLVQTVFQSSENAPVAVHRQGLRNPCLDAEADPIGSIDSRFDSCRTLTGRSVCLLGQD